MSPSPILFLEPHPHRLLSDAVGLIVRPAGAGGEHDSNLEVSREEWPTLWTQLKRHRIGSHVSPLVRDGALIVPNSVHDDVKRHARSVAILRLRLQAALSRQLRVLNDASIDVRVLKGLATGPLDHEDEVHRHTADVDLLVRRVDFEQACALVGAAAQVEVDPIRPAHLLVERTFRDPDGIEIDLHHRLFRFGQAHDLLFDSSEQLPNELGVALSAEGRLVHAAAHLLIAPPGRSRLSGLVDVARLSRPGKADIDHALRLAESFGVRGLVQFAIWLAESIGHDNPKPPPRRRSLIDFAYCRTGRRVDLETAAVLRDLNGVRDRVDYVRFQLTRDRTNSGES